MSEVQEKVQDANIWKVYSEPVNVAVLLEKNPGVARILKYGSVCGLFWARIPFLGETGPLSVQEAQTGFLSPSFEIWIDRN